MAGASEDCSVSIFARRVSRRTREGPRYGGGPVLRDGDEVTRRRDVL